MIRVLYLAPLPEQTDMTALLPAPDFEVTIAGLAEEGIGAPAYEAGFDCVVVDAGMSDKDVGGMIRQLRSFDATLPVVFSSATEIRPEYYTKAINEGADYCLPHLSEMPEVLSAIVRRLAKRGATSPKQAALPIDTGLSLINQNERLDLVSKAAKIGIWDVDFVTGESYVNDEWFRMLAIDRDRMPDPLSGWEDLVFQDDRAEATGKFGRFMDGRDEVFAVDYRMNCGDGWHEWFSDCAIAAGRDRSGRPNRIIRVFVSIDRLKKAYGYLKEANKKMNMITSVVRHDALNQITGMMIFMDMLKDLAEDDDDLNRYVDQIDRGMNSIHDKLVFTRDYHGLGEQDPVWQDLSCVISEVLPDIEMEGIPVETKLDGLEIYSVPLLRTVFMRLIENSVRHGEKATRVTVSYSLTDGGCSIVLEDDGIGIPAGEKSQIFRNAYGKNAGYGLFIARNLLSVTGIMIEENGEEGRGARFEMTVPGGMYRLAGEGGRKE